MAFALGLVLLASGKILAQQVLPPENWPTDDAYIGTNDGQSPAAQPDGYGQQPYRQPKYTEEPRYDQPANPQQHYPQQNNSQQAYLNVGTEEPGYQPERALNPEQLEQIVAPIALYPDNLLAQVLAASTYPAQVAAADQWRRAQGNASAEQIVAGADAQTNWDPSVKALTAFPEVLAEMARNLPWTTDLGNAYYNQPQDVMQTVQVMRDRAQAAGNLQSTPQEQVTVDQGNIELAPADPQMVYVPRYDPWSVYGQQVSPYPGFSLLDAVGSFLGASPIQYGLGIAMQAFSSTPWGWLGWGLDWLTHSVLFNHDSYYSRSNSVADWGFPYGGRRAFRGGWERGGYRERGVWGHGEYPRQRSGYDHGYNRGFDRARRELGGGAGRYTGGHGGDGYGRGYQGFGSSHDRYSQQAYNRMQDALGRERQHEGGQERFFGGRPQPYGGRSDSDGRMAYGSGTYGRSFQNRDSGHGMAYANPTYRMPESGYRLTPGGGSYRGYGSNSGHSNGGFHLFGHGRDSQGFSSSNRGSGGNNWGGGGHSSHSFGGFGGGGYKAPKASHFGGGGGGHSGGGRSGSGHSNGGGHSGGHGHHH